MKIRNEANSMAARLLRSGASLMVVSAMLAAVSPSAAYAQDAQDAQDAGQSTQSGDTSQDALPQADDTAIIVTGQRAALQTSQNIKRDADTVVDSITATDIGAFPDKSVAEALQRVAGITVNRFAASDDTSHFSAEPSGVLVRGLQQVRNEFNGRDVFSANSSRGLGWGDISPELLGGVDTYKNQTAELIEGGIAGTVNLRTRLPFDSSGQQIQLSANLNYGDISMEATPDISGLYSNRWQTGAGEFGLLLNYAYSNVKTASQGVQYGRMGVFEGITEYGGGTRYIPTNVAFRDNLYDRTRNGFSGAAQWRDNSGTITATAQYQRSLYKNVWRERAVTSYISDLFAVPVDFRFTQGGENFTRIPHAAPGTPAFTFDEDGNFLSGTIVQQQTDNGWWGGDDAEAATMAVNSLGQNFYEPCYNWGNAAGPCGADAKGLEFTTATRRNQNRQFTQDASFNLKWEASDTLRFNFDAQYVQSEVDNYDVEVGQSSYANLRLDATGGIPRAQFLPGTNLNYSPGGLTNPNNYYYHHMMDHVEDSEGEQWAARLDAEYDFNSDWLASLKVGARYADRDQTVRWSNYNWGNLANHWTLGGTQYTYWNIDRFQPSAASGFTGYPQGLIDVRNFGSGFFGGTLGSFAFFDMDELAAHGIDKLSVDRIGVGSGAWRPVCERPTEVADSCFTEVEINDVSETTKAAYAMLRFGGANAMLGGMSVRGNIGVRYVETLDRSNGFLRAPVALTPSQLACENVTVPPGAPAPGIPRTVGCYLSADDIAFNNGGGTAQTARAVHRNWLPSLNIRLDLVPDRWILRFAGSKAMSRPDIGLLKNFVNVGVSLPANGDASDPRYVRNAAGVVTGVTPRYTADAYNPYLKPTTATQFDLALEHYFAAVGSLTLTGFYKNFDNYIQYGSYDLDVTNNGVTRTVQVRGPLNGDGAEVYGGEAAFQTYFTFLPQPFDGLGIQANYTYVKNQGIKNSNVRTVSGTSGGSTAVEGAGATTLSVDSLEGLSEHSFNIVGMYEKGPLALRAAYNWRSDYLVTAVDCCVYLPVWAKAQGFLDASIRYGITQNFEVSLQGTNLLNTKTVLEQQINDAEDGGIRVPNSWFQNDRRFVLGVRLKL